MKMDFADRLPADLDTICQTLEQANHLCYLVGGAVRDLLLGLTPKDFDLACDALPEQIEALFHDTIPTGKEFGTITVQIHTTPYEITTFRQDWLNPDGSRQGQMIFSSSLLDDLAFRDYTINAMAYHLSTGELIDPFSGYADLKAGLLRSVGDAKQRFREDALRMLRGVRLSVTKGLTMTPTLREAIRECRSWVTRVSPERIATELSKILTSPQPGQGLADLDQLLLLEQIFPEVAIRFRKDSHLLEEIIDRLDADHRWMEEVDGEALESSEDYIPLEKRPELNQPDSALVIRFALLFTSLSSPVQRGSDYKDQSEIDLELVQNLLDQYRFSTTIKKSVLTLLTHVKVETVSDYQLRQLLSSLGNERLAYWWVRWKQARTESDSHRDLKPDPQLLDRINTIYQTQTPLQISDLKITGHDLILHVGVKPGPTLGHLLHQLLERVLQDPALNQPCQLLQLAKEESAQ